MFSQGIYTDMIHTLHIQIERREKENEHKNYSFNRDSLCFSGPYSVAD